jgi:hypothetical protein
VNAAAAATNDQPASQPGDALIRSMLTSTGNVAALTESRPNAYKRASWPQTASSSAQDSNPPSSPPMRQRVPALPSVVLAMIQPDMLQPDALQPDMIQPDTARALPTAAAGKAIAPKLPGGATVLTDAPNAELAAPLAFSMRLTPVAEPGSPDLAPTEIAVTETAAEPTLQSAPAVPEVPASVAATQPETPPPETEDRNPPQTAPAPSSSPIKEMALHIATPQGPAVDVQLTERGGQLHVSVRTADEGLQTSLRQDLGSLVNSLEHSGYRAEAFTPPEGSPAAVMSPQTGSQNGRQNPSSAPVAETAAPGTHA